MGIAHGSGALLFFLGGGAGAARGAPTAACSGSQLTAHSEQRKKSAQKRAAKLSWRPAVKLPSSATSHRSTAVNRACNGGDAGASTISAHGSIAPSSAAREGQSPADKPALSRATVCSATNAACFLVNNTCDQASVAAKAHRRDPHSVAGRALEVLPEQYLAGQRMAQRAPRADVASE